MTVRRCHYVLSAHWDREWYQTFQHYRYRLVALLDHVLDGMADGRLLGPWVADGQAIIAEDYLEVRPERRSEVLHRVAEGKLALGPWYVMPDEFIPSGESLVRNLRYGRDLVRSLGGRPSAAGFVCDIFSHNSQFPQILAGFGIRMAFVWRGSNQRDWRHFTWRSPDGSAVIAYRFGDYAYCDYAGWVRHLFEPGYAHTPASIAGDLEHYLAAEAAHTEVGPVLLFDGGDHQDWDEEVYAVLRERISAGPQDDFEVVHSSLDDYIAEVLPQAAAITPQWTGELREPASELVHRDLLAITPSVLSSRVWIKQENAACETLLCNWAEPFSAFAANTAGTPDVSGFLNVAWRWLLQNQPHDSICGCSIDDVHEQMRYRFAQSRDIGERVTTEALQALTARIELEQDGEGLRVVVFNPLPRPIEEPVELTLEIPAAWATYHEFFGYEALPAFRIYDPARASGSDGVELLYQRLSQRMNQPRMRIFRVRGPEGYQVHEVKVCLPLALPAMGYCTLIVRPATEATRLTRYPAVPGLVKSDHELANEYLVVTIEPGGRLSLYDRRTGATFTHLLTFEDCADIGDGYYLGPAINDQVFTSAAAHAEVALVHNGPFLATLRVRTTLVIPRRFDAAGMIRSPEMVDLVIDSLVTLRRSADRVEVVTVVHNNASDHRLRVLFPSGAIRADTYLADSPFDVVKRPIALRRDNYLARELEMETKPQSSWTAVWDGSRGLAIISAGLRESAVCDLPDRPIALTLFRSTARTVGTGGEPGGQLHGDLTFHYWIAPLTSEPDRCRLCDLGQQLAAGTRSTQTIAGPSPARPASGDAAVLKAPLPAKHGFLEVSAPAVVTSVRHMAGRKELEVRMFNPTESAMEITIAAADLGYTTWQRVDLESHPLTQPLLFANGQVSFTIGAKEIATLSLRRE